jgi:hypothetical protein
LREKVNDPNSIREVSDPNFKAEYDVEVQVGDHTFRRNRRTGRWCRFSDPLCNLETPADINAKVDETLSGPDANLHSPEAETTKISPEELPKTEPRPGEPGSPEHRAARWREYQERTSPDARWSKERWDKQYDINMRQAKQANAATDLYHEQLGWGEREVTVDVNGEARRFDIADPATQRGIEYKTGDTYASQDILSEVRRDAILVDQGWEITWVFRDHASEPLIAALRKARIKIILRGVPI